jgi:hypothetical protein
MPTLQPSAAFAQVTPPSLPLPLSRVHALLPRFIQADPWDEEILSKAAPSLSTALEINLPAFSAPGAPSVLPLFAPTTVDGQILPRSLSMLATPLDSTASSSSMSQNDIDALYGAP